MEMGDLQKKGHEFGPGTIDMRLFLHLIVMEILISPLHRMQHPMAQNPCRLGLRGEARGPSAPGVHGESCLNSLAADAFPSALYTDEESVLWA